MSTSTTSTASRSQQAKSNILAKLKKQVAGADYSKLPIEPSFTYPELSAEQQVENFVTLLQTNHADVCQVKPENVFAMVEAQLKKRNIGSLLYGEHGRYGQELAQYFDANPDIDLINYDFQLTDNLVDNKEKLFEHCPASITSSLAGIAATGSIVLWPSEAEPRTMSLVPPVHFVIVQQHQIVSDLASLMTAQSWGDGLPTNVLLVSGPSKTADIQQTLAYGAHGPKELVVLLVEN